MPWTRASELERAVVCPASTHLARLEGSTSEAAAWGNAVHEWKETGKWPGRLRKDVVARRELALKEAGMSRESLWPVEIGQHEVSFALNTESGEALTYEADEKSEREEWKSSLGPLWITGTADWFSPDYAPGVSWIDDLKTGRREYLPVPEEAWQLRFYALCAALLTGSSVVRVTFTSWPRSPADEPPLRLEGGIARDTLLSYLPLLDTARRKAEFSASFAPLYVPTDEGCKFCKAAVNCPAAPEVL